MAGQDKVKGNSFGNVNFFIFGEGKGAPIQNWGTGGQSGGIQPEHSFAKGIWYTWRDWVPTIYGIDLLMEMDLLRLSGTTHLLCKSEETPK